MLAGEVVRTGAGVGAGVFISNGGVGSGWVGVGGVGAGGVGAGGAGAGGAGAGGAAATPLEGNPGSAVMGGGFWPLPAVLSRWDPLPPCPGLEPLL